MTKTIIHVNRRVMAQNIKRPHDPLPVYTVKQGKSNRYGYAVEILGPSQMVDIRTAGQLSCGARAWLETQSPVRVLGEMSWDELVARQTRDA